MNKALLQDKERYASGKLPAFQKYYRKAQTAQNAVTRLIYKCLLHYFNGKYHVELGTQNQIGDGLYFGHPYGITIKPNVKIGRNVNIHKGVTIGQENRGKRKGAPSIGDDVWIGINSTIVGKITIGNDVLIAPNSYVNCDIPDHSIVLGNPCIIKHCDHATENYINRKAKVED